MLTIDCWEHKNDVFMCNRVLEFLEKNYTNIIPLG